MTFPSGPLADDMRWFPIEGAGTVGAVRRAATGLGEQLGLPERRIAELAILTTELASNLHKHARDGTVLVRSLRRAGSTGVGLVGVDAGPGIPDVARAVRDGHSTAGTLGIGLGAIGRQASWWDVYSLPGAGTVVAAEVWSDGTAAPPWADGLTRPIAGETMSGDAFAVRSLGGRAQVLVSDGLGHGPLAADASRVAVDSFCAAPGGGPAEIVEHLHKALARTRGAAVMVAELDPAAEVVRAAGLGNIAGILLGAGTRRQLVTLPGIAGHQRQRVREFAYPLPDGALVVLHSDGMTNRWDPDRYPGLLSHSPVVVAAILLRDGGTRRDDAGVLVAKVPA
ncbi:MAG TPA: ATP-binding SpoIIE family protein phosphatase [Micromonosporaceae bacterium]|nr:ATP-binding SpoIIE family protein phosphatase [Micromonosporaceae bacterium]